MNNTAMKNTATAPRPAPGAAGPVLLVLAGGAVSHAGISRTAELAAGAPVTVLGVGSTAHHVSPTPEQVRRTVALAMSILEDTGVMATGHVAVTGSPARAVARLARACGARAVILDQSGPSGGGQSVHSDVGGSAAGQGSSGRGGAGTVGLMAELRRRIHGSGIVVLAETGRRGGWVSA
jgi:hypothetical protein